MEDSRDPIDAAIESAESLIASFLVREKSGRLAEEETDKPPGRHDLVHEPNGLHAQDPELSLFLPPSDLSLVTEGAASLWPSNRTASSQAILPELEGNLSPKESLHALVNKVSESSPLESLDVGTLQRMLHERDKDIEVAAKLGQLLLRRNEIMESDLTRTLEQKTLLEQQLRHCQQAMVKKEELLRLYASEQQEETPASSGHHSSRAQPEWVQVLADECRELRESNHQLQGEADRLKKETAEVELKEKELVQHCLEQFTEAKRRLAELREEAEQKQDENLKLQGELKGTSSELSEVHERWEERQSDLELVKEQLEEAQEQNLQLTHSVLELQERLEDVTVVLKEAKDENTVLKDAAVGQSSSPPGEPGQVEHESIVREIEEVLRKEIIAASTLPERPRSPNNYAHQRTMVVMETVRAATLASSRRQKRLKAAVAAPQPEKPLPLATSSPNYRTTSNPAGLNSSLPTSLPGSLASPVQAYPEEIIRYRNQTYVAPEKLQIVKPLEGSVTLLKWKLLATPQLGGATTFFSDASRPGVHLKKWKAGGVQDAEPSAAPGSAGTDAKSLHVSDMSSLEQLNPGGEGGSKGEGVELGDVLASANALSNSGTSEGRTTPCTGTVGPSSLLQKRSSMTAAGNVTTAKNSPSTSQSLLGQVGSFLGSGWSRLSTQGDTSTDSATPNPNHERSSTRHEVEESTGLAALLDL